MDEQLLLAWSIKECFKISSIFPKPFDKSSSERVSILDHSLSRENSEQALEYC